MNVLNILRITAAQSRGMRNIMQGIAGISPGPGCRDEKLDACDIALAHHHLVQGIWGMIVFSRLWDLYMALDLRSHSAEWQTSILIWSAQAGFKSIMFS